MLTWAPEGWRKRGKPRTIWRVLCQWNRKTAHRLAKMEWSQGCSCQQGRRNDLWRLYMPEGTKQVHSGDSPYCFHASFVCPPTSNKVSLCPHPSVTVGSSTRLDRCSTPEGNTSSYSFFDLLIARFNFTTAGEFSRCSSSYLTRNISHTSIVHVPKALHKKEDKATKSHMFSNNQIICEARPLWKRPGGSPSTGSTVCWFYSMLTILYRLLYLHLVPHSACVYRIQIMPTGSTVSIQYNWRIVFLSR